MAKRRSKIQQIVFKFGNDYRVFTNYPYTVWMVYWGGSKIGEYNFSNADEWQPERTVTPARARYCFEQSTEQVKV